MHRKSLALRVTVLTLATGSALLTALVPPHAEWSVGAQVVLWIAKIAVWAACTLAVVIAVVQPRHAAAASLAFQLTFFGLCFAAGSAAMAHPYVHAALKKPAAAVALVSLLASFAALARVSVTFPQPLTRDQLEAKLAVWRPAAQRKRYGGQSYRKIDNRGIRYIAALWPKARRKGVVRTLIQQRRQGMAGGKPQMPTSWFGLPWTSWRLAAWTAPVTAVLVLTAPVQFGILWAVLWSVIFGIHALVYFLLGYQLGDATARRQSLWVLAGSLAGVGLVCAAGMLNIFVEAFFAFATFTGLDVYRDVPLVQLIEGPLNHGAFMLASLVVILSLAVAIFRYGALDPKLVIQSTALYGAVGVILTGSFIVVEALATSYIEANLTLPRGTGSWIAGAGIALAFGPLRFAVMRRTSVLVDRMIPAGALAEGTRKNAAVLFADLAGYVALAAANETQALTAASLFHKQARNIAGEYRGRLVKTVGDGVLLTFPDVVSAYAAAEKLHRDYPQACDLLGLDRVRVQSGLNYGEIVESSQGDVFGMTVNLAARLEAVAAADELIISKSAAAHLPELVQIRLESLGTRELRNISEPVSCFRANFSTVKV